MIPEEAAVEIKSKANTEIVKPERVAEIERETNHDIASLLRLWLKFAMEMQEYVHFALRPTTS